MSKDADQETIDRVVAMIDKLVAPAMEEMVNLLNKKLEKDNLKVGFDFKWYLGKGEENEG